MTSILDLKFASDDSDDSSYVESELGSDISDTEDFEGTQAKASQHLDNKDKEKRAALLLNSMVESWITQSNVPRHVCKYNVLAPFHLPQEIKNPVLENTSVEELLDYLNRTSGTKKGLNNETSQNLDIKAIKQELRDNENVILEDPSDQTKEKKLEDSVITTKESVMFAGQVYEKEKSISKDVFEKSRMKKRKLGGSLSQLQKISDSLKSLNNITSVVKSRADWEKYKKEKNIENKNVQGENYLDKQKFLIDTDVVRCEANILARKQRRLYKNL